ncbi:MAG: hypothetical protein KY468_08490 [Armatimonadetes bacterium]|nr:hypothetical protein [Armatimonadota bacterium]
MPRRILPALCLFLALSGGVRAQEEQIPDERLKQKITYSASAKPLQTVTEELTKQTGVLIRVGSSERDWKNKERRVHLHFRNLPLGVALQQTAKMLGYEFRRAGEEGKWSYRLYQSPRNRDYEAAMLNEQKTRKEQEIASLRETVLNDADEVLNMSPEEAAKLKDKDPWKSYLGGTKSGRAYAELLRGLPSEARELMLRGRRVSMNVSELTPSMRTAMQQMVDESFFKQMGPEAGPMRQAFDNASPERLTFMPLDQEMLMGPMSASAMGMAGVAMVMGDLRQPNPEMERVMDQMEGMGMGRGVPMAAMPLTGGNSVAGRMFAQMMNRLESGEKFQDIQQEMMQTMQNGGAIADDPSRKIEPTPTPTEPALLVEVEPLQLKMDLLGQTSQSAELVEQLGKKTNLSYAVEYHPDSAPLAMYLPRTKQPLYKLLDTLQSAGLLWEYDNGVVRIRPKDWAVLRSYDVPENMIDGYRKILAAKGWLDLDTLGSLSASLTDGQIQYRILKDPELGVLMMTLMPMGGNRDLFRFYGELTPAQKERLKSPQGLPFDQISESQWQRLTGWLEEATLGAEIRPGRISLALKEEEVRLPAPMREGSVPGGRETPSAEAKTGPAPQESPAASPSSTPAQPQPPRPPADPPSAAPKGAVSPETAPPQPGQPTAQPGQPSAPPMPSGAAYIQATLTDQMEADEPDAPVKLSKRINVPTAANIEMMKRGREQMRKQMEEMQKKPEAPKEVTPALKAPERSGAPPPSARPKPAGSAGTPPAKRPAPARKR